MKKHYFFLIFSIAILTDIFAQEGVVFNKRGGNSNRSDRSKAVMIGIKGGLNIANMMITNEIVNRYEKTSITTFKAGVFVEIPVVNYFSIAPEVIYMGRGTAVKFVKKDVNGIERKWVYRILPKYVDVRVPLILGYPLNKTFYPYVFASPDFAFAVGGKISLKDDNDSGYEVDVNKNNLKAFDLGVVFGGGIRMNLNFDTFSLVVKLDVAYNNCFINNYSDAELDGSAEAENGIQAYHINDDDIRLNNGLEFTFSLGLPLKFDKKSGCSDFGNKHDRRY